ncbi:hypothetical protein DFP73DRAFT_528444 [Morchella snyderi]|nr:hypothetical protein DFP73DRAFT_528444 [Morchella snyderi]
MEMDLDDQFVELNNAFTSWLTGPTGNVTLNPKIGLTDLRTSSAGRGVVATAPLDEDETVFSVPRFSVLSVESSELHGKLGEELTSLGPWLALILVLIYETRLSSPWRPYIDVLPVSFNTLMYWANDELAELQASAVVAKIGKQDADELFRDKLWPIVKKHAGMFSDTIIAPGLAIDAIDSLLDAAHRMGSIIMSYSFDLEVVGERGGSDEDSDSDDDEDEGKFYKGMIPMADMLNADADRNNCRLFQTPTVLEMRTTRAVAAGDELFNDYGPLPRSDLLRRYGYITPNYAQYDVVEISSELIVGIAGKALDGSDKTERIDYLLDEDVLDDAFDIGTDLEISEEVLAVISNFLLTKGEFSVLKGKGKVAKPKKTPEVAKVLEEILEKRLGEYGTTVEDDENLLCEEGAQGRKKIAIEVRLGEKKILKGALEKVRGWALVESAKRAHSSQVGDERGEKRVKAR